MQKRMKIWFIFIFLIALALSFSRVEAAGTKNMAATQDVNGEWTYVDGRRPYTEWFKGNNGISSMTAGIERTQVLYVYAKKGETIHLGSSVANTVLNNGYEISVTLPNGASKNLNIVNDGVGHINTSEKELNGPNYGHNKDGFDAVQLYIDGEENPEGIYKVMFYSYNGTATNVNTYLKGSNDSVFSLNNGLIASYDATVVSNEDGIYEEKTGRVWADYLCINMGINEKATLYSNLYVLTTDGFVYHIDLNGIDPWGFIFFANNRGLIDSSNNTSLYMSVFAKDNQCTTPYYIRYGNESIPVQFHKPNTADTKYDKTYKVFFEEPDEDLPEYIKPIAYEPGAIKDIRFQGIDCDVGTGRVGEGGYFYFTVENASSYELKLDFAGLTRAKKDKDGNYVLDNDGNKIYERVQAVDRLNRKLYYDTEEDEEVGLLDSEYAADPTRYEPIYVDGTVYLRNSCVDGENRVYWNGKDQYGHYLPRGTYGNDDCDIKVEITPKAGEYHFIMIDVENNRTGTKVTMTSDVHSSSGEVLDMPDDERNTVYYNNNNSELTKVGSSGNKNGASAYTTEAYNHTFDGVDTRYEGGALFQNNLGDASLVDVWSYVTRQSADKTEVTQIKEFVLLGVDPDDPGPEDPEDPDDPDDPTVVGSLTGKVFYDANQNGVYAVGDSDILLENVKVKLFKKTFDTENKIYVYEQVSTDITDATGTYRFANLEVNEGTYTYDNGTEEITVNLTEYEVRVIRPDETYTVTTGDNEIQTGITIVLDQDDLSKLDVTADDVGYYVPIYTPLPDPEDPEDPNPKEYTGTIAGRVFFDYNKNGGSMNLTEGDYPLDDIIVTLYKYIPELDDYEELSSIRTDSLGNYYFANLLPSENGFYYEVRVTSPNSYATCTTHNQIISDIEIILDEDDLSMLDVVNDDVGFYWSFKTITVNKGWTVKEDAYPRIKLSLSAYYLEDGVPVEVPELKVENVSLSSTNGWNQIFNLSDKYDDKVIFYYVTDELLYHGVDDNGNEIWKTPEEAGYSYSIDPLIGDIIPNTSAYAMNITNRKSCITLTKNVDEIVKEDTTFKFELIDNGLILPDGTLDPSQKGDNKVVEVTIPAGKKKVTVMVEQMSENHNYSIKEIDIPDMYYLNVDNCTIYIDDQLYDEVVLNNSNNLNSPRDNTFSMNFDYSAHNSYEAYFDNATYKSNILVTKEVRGNRGDTSMNFQYQIVLGTEKELDGVKTLQDGTTQNFKFFSGDSFELKDGESIEFMNIPYGTAYRIVENDYTTTLKYVTTVNDETSRQVEGVLEDDNLEFNYVNELTQKTGTGVESTMKTGLVIITIVLGVGVGYILISKKKNSNKAVE